MSSPLSPTDIRCKDGAVFTVDRKCGSITVFANFHDDLRTSSGLSRFATFHEPGDARSEHARMPVEIVRAYAKAHGGVAEAGPQALALLKELASTAAPAPDPEPAPVPEAAAAVEEAADPRPFPEKPDPRWPRPGWSITVCRMPAPYQH